MKKCKQCSEIKSLESFPKNSRMSDGKHYYCKSCSNSRSISSYRQKREMMSEVSDFWERKRECSKCNIEKANSQFTKAGTSLICKDCSNLRSRASKYSISVKELSDMLSTGCSVCGSFDKLVIDHDHSCCNYRKGGRTSCGKCIRGILCQNCNIAEGCIVSIEQIENLKAYMIKHLVI